MERLIDATRIEQYILNNCSDNEEINTIYAEIINAPTVDPIKHGHWGYVGHGLAGESICKCSICGHQTPDDGNYCSYCGAKMDEVKDENT